MSAMNPVLSGLMRGLSIGNMLRRTAMEKELLERQKLRDERTDQLQDLEVMQRLQQIGRPVEGGRVTSPEVIHGDTPAGMLPETAGALGIGDRITQMNRPADARRTARYKMRDGQTLETELLTPEEQARIAMQQRIQDSQVGRALKRVNIPGYDGPVDPEVVPYLTAEANRKASDARAEAQRKAADKRSEEAAKSRVTAAEVAARGREATARARAGEAASRQATERQEKATEKAESERKAAVQKWQAAHDRADEAEQKLHAEMEAAGKELRSISERLKVNDLPPTEQRLLHQRRMNLEGKIAGARGEAERLNKRKKWFLDQKERARGGQASGGKTGDPDAEAEAYLNSLR